MIIHYSLITLLVMVVMTVNMEVNDEMKILFTIVYLDAVHRDVLFNSLFSFSVPFTINCRGYFLLGRFSLRISFSFSFSSMVSR